MRGDKTSTPLGEPCFRGCLKRRISSKLLRGGRDSNPQENAEISTICADLSHGDGRADDQIDALSARSHVASDESRTNLEGKVLERGPIVRADFAGVVETALAEALTLAARAAHWSLVELLARELAERREQRDAEPSRQDVRASPRSIGSEK